MRSFICDICGYPIQGDHVKKDELIICSDCVCSECGEVMVLSDRGIFKDTICKSCEEGLYIDVIEERINLI